MRPADSGMMKVLGLCMIFIAAQCLFASNPVTAEPGKGKGKGQQNSVEKNRGNSGQKVNKGKSAKGQATAALARKHIHSSHYKHKGGVHFDATNTSGTGIEDTSLNVRQRHAHGKALGHEHSNRKIVQGFQDVLDKIRARGNNAPFEMLDPYGLVKDDRKELYGNRGRPLKGDAEPPPPPEEPPTDPPEEPPPPDDPPTDPPEEPTEVTVTEETVNIIELMVWNGEDTTRQLLSDQGYTDTEIDLLLSVSLSDLQAALDGDGTINF